MDPGGVCPEAGADVRSEGSCQASRARSRRRSARGTADAERRRDGHCHLGLSQDDLAQQLGVERSTVVRWEAGRTGPRPYVRPLLADALRVTVDQLEDLLRLTEEELESVRRREFTGLAAGIALSPLVRPRFGSRIGASEVRQLLHARRDSDAWMTTSAEWTRTTCTSRK